MPRLIQPKERKNQTMKTNDVKNLRLKLSECGKSLESCGTVSVTIAQLNPCGSLTTKEQREVAERIVQAVNHHEELMAALEVHASSLETCLASPTRAKIWREVAEINAKHLRSLLTKLKG